MSRRPLLGAAAFCGLLACTRSTELLDTSASCLAPVVHLGGTDDAHCAGALSAQFGRYAICSCDDLIVTGDLFVGSLGGPGPPPSDTAAGPPPSGTSSPPPSSGDEGAGGGSGTSSHGTPGVVGVNGDVWVSGPTVLNGSMVVGGSGGIKIAGGIVQGNLRSDGSIATLKPTQVGGDMFAEGDVNGPYLISGVLHLPNSATVGASVYAPTVVREDVSFPSPCGCGSAPLFDIAGAVTERKTKNSNSSLPFADTFADEVNTSQTFDWPCGEYYFSGLRTGRTTSLEFRIHGHVGIFIDGDVSLGNNLTVTLEHGAELDLVIAGSFFTTGRLFGTPMAPARVRLWVASTTVSLPDQIQFGSTVYAPSAVLSAGVGLTLNGTFFVQTISATEDVNVYYDDKAATGGESCGISAPLIIE